MIISRHQKGFTLVEMVLYVSLCSIILLSSSMLLSSLLGSRIRNQTINEVNQQGFQVIQLVTQTIRNSRSIQVPTIGVSSSTLSITTGNALVNPTVFWVSSSTFMIQEGGKTPITLTNSRVVVSSLSFQNISSASSSEKIIKISFTVDYNNQSGKPEYSYTKTFNGSATLR